MQLPNTSSHASRGFTLIEVVIVIALVSVIATFGLLLSMDAYRGFSFRSERDIVVSLLTRARSAAMANMYNTPWGVCISGGTYVVFRGTTCAVGGTSEQTPISAGVSVSGLTTPVVFYQVGGTTTPTTITITQNAKSSNITINYEGAIIW
jgi:prepilin-type N-terminal cleavage/methylation domain-containing protein